jgi:hypothetical protein
MPRQRAEIGALGLPLFSGFLSLDPNTRLRGRRGAEIYRTMARDEPVAGAFLGAAYNLLRTDLAVTPGGSTEPDKKAAEFLEQCLLDMRDATPTYLRQLYGMLWAGWSVSEVVYKRRSGGQGSRYEDGRVGWATWALRRQETLYKWGQDKNGRITSVQQQISTGMRSGVLDPIPLTKCIHVVADDSEGSPEGVSCMRPMYIPLAMVKQIRLLYGIALERGAGLPVVEFEQPGIEPSQEVLDLIDEIFAGLRMNEKSGIRMPAGMKFRFAELPGVRGKDYQDAIQFFQVWALAAGLADFVALGTGATGSFALGKDKSELFLLSLNGFQDKLLNALNRQCVPQLFRYNDFRKLTDLPRLSLPAVRRYDLEGLGRFAQLLHNIGAFHPTPEDEDLLRKISDLPDLDMETLRALHAAQPHGEAAPVCPSCGAVNEGGATVCMQCGEPLPQAGGRQTGGGQVETGDEEGTDEEEVSVEEDEDET